MSGRVLSFGEALWDLLPGGPVLGGAPLNFAFRLNSLGTPCLPVSQLGGDELGREARRQIRSLGLDDRFIFESADAPTGKVQITFGEGGQPRYEIQRQVAYDCIPVTEALLETASASSAFCFGTLAQRSPASRSTLCRLLRAAEKALVVFDVNLRAGQYSEDRIRESLEPARICKLNEEEMAELTRMFGFGCRDLREAAQRLRSGFALDLVVVTMGAQGAFVVAEGGDTVTEAGHIAPPGGDPCGAGDAFTAGFLHVLLRGGPVAEAALFGNALGAMVAGQTGATIPISPEDIRAFMLCSQRRVVEDMDFLIP